MQSGQAPFSHALAVVSALLLGAAAADAGSLDRPNILLLVAEDMSPRVGAFADPAARTPEIDGLARQGLRYANVYTTAGVCAPSRAALVTGLHAISFGAQHMRTSSRPEGGYAAVPPPEVRAFPELLRAAGYYTYTDSKLDYQFSGVLSGSGPASIWDDEGRATHWRNRPRGQPFFGLVNFQVTHESGLFPPLGSWPHSPMHFAMQLVRAWLFGRTPGAGATRPEEIVLPPYYPDTATVRSDMARHYDNIHAMDRQVGELLGQLAEDGLADSTIVIWTTDHGDGLPRAKRELYDSGLHVPMIIRWPESLRPPGAARRGWDEQLVSFVDLAPTILTLAGSPVPEWMQGRSFLGGSEAREFVFAARDRIDAQPDRQRAVRDQRYKYIRSWHPEVPGGHPLAFRDNLEMMRELWILYEASELDEAQRSWFEAPGVERLYDTSSDPHELINLAADPEHRMVLERMRRALDAWLARVGDTSQEPEAAMVERFWPDGEQPQTAAPALALERGRLQITNATPGAASEFRVGDGPWRLYTGPAEVPPSTPIQARSVRYGWAESGPVRLSAP